MAVDKSSRFLYNLKINRGTGHEEQDLSACEAQPDGVEPAEFQILKGQERQALLPEKETQESGINW